MIVRAALVVFAVLLSLPAAASSEGVSAAYPGAASTNEKGEAVPYPQAGYVNGKGETVPYPPHPVILPSPTPLPAPVTPLPGHACPEDAKICPDGTGVSRIGPKCEFAPCPATAR